MKLDVIVITHAGLAGAFVDAVEMIMGPQPKLKAIAFQEGDDMVETGNMLAEMIRSSGADFTLILTDLYGATPTNAALFAVSQCENAAVVTGVNLISVIHALDQDGEDIDSQTLLRVVSQEGQKGIRAITRDMILEGKGQ